MIKTIELTKNHIIRSITIYPFHYKISHSMQSRSNFNAQSYDLSGEGLNIANTISALQFFISRLLPADGIFARKGRENGSGNLYEVVSVFQGLWYRMQEPVACQSGSRWPDRDYSTRKHPLRCAMFLWVITLRIMRAIIISNLTI